MKYKRWLAGVMWGILLAAECFLIWNFLKNYRANLDFAAGRLVKRIVFAAVLCLPVSLWKPRWAAWATGALTAVFAGAIGFLLIFSAVSRYRPAPVPTNPIFAGHRVMIIAPHEDDDINLMGGVIEEYVAAGSEVYPVFVTNGDARYTDGIRLREALRCLKGCGVPEENVIFMGYGDKWRDDGPHIYNAPEGVVLHSFAGHTQTYALPYHPPYHDGAAYTIDNLLGDMKQIILEYRPDVICCADLDTHLDHQAVSMNFERVMADILRENDDYRPTVLKGYCYANSWQAKDDFYRSVNLLSTLKETDAYRPNAAVYRWEDRLRLPVYSEGLSHSLFSTSVYRALSAHATQCAVRHAGRVCNSDKVFWERSLDSLTYRATVSASSGAAGRIHDFQLYDDDNLMNEQPSQNAGVWVPDAGDPVKTVTVTLEQPADIQWLYLYDNPAEEHNVLRAEVRFDGGDPVSVGPLENDGSASRIPVDVKQVSTVSITLLDTEGQWAGLSEVELYSETPRSAFDFIKITDMDGNFVYDHLGSEENRFCLYRSGEAPALSEEDYTVSVEGKDCSAVIEGDTILVTCPRGKECIIRVSSKDGRYQDGFYLSNKWNLVQPAQQLEAVILRLWANSDVYHYGARFLSERQGLR